LRFRLANVNLRRPGQHFEPRVDDAELVHGEILESQLQRRRPLLDTEIALRRIDELRIASHRVYVQPQALRLLQALGIDK